MGRPSGAVCGGGADSVDILGASDYSTKILQAALLLLQAADQMSERERREREREREREMEKE